MAGRTVVQAGGRLNLTSCYKNLEMVAPGIRFTRLCCQVELDEKAVMPEVETHVCMRARQTAPPEVV